MVMGKFFVLGGGSFRLMDQIFNNMSSGASRASDDPVAACAYLVISDDIYRWIQVRSRGWCSWASHKLDKISICCLHLVCHQLFYLTCHLTPLVRRVLIDMIGLGPTTRG